MSSLNGRTRRERKIRVRGAREHNLKDLSLDIPRDKLIVITGLSGSGKSSLAFDTLYGEGQRRYIESLSAYARQFIDQIGKPEHRNQVREHDVGQQAARARDHHGPTEAAFSSVARRCLSRGGIGDHGDNQASLRVAQTLDARVGRRVSGRHR